MSNRLSGLTDHELLARVHKLRGGERETTLEILRHLNEVERRKLHLKLGYSSMFVYCTEHLCYSESSAGRRVQSARCLSRFPQIEPLLVRGDINLVTLALVASLLTPQNVDWFMQRIRNKRQREVEAIVSAFRPASFLRDRVLRVNVPAPVTPSPPSSASASNPALASNPSSSTTSPPPGERTVSPGPLLVNIGSNSHCGSEKLPNVVATVSKLYIQFLADEAFMRDYNEACALLSNTLPRPSFATVFGAVLRDYLERNSPKRRQLRRDARRASPGTQREAGSQTEAAQSGERAHAAEQPHVAEQPHAAEQPPVAEQPNAVEQPQAVLQPHAARLREALRRPVIAAETRDAVFVRDRGQCTYVGIDGRRCGQTHGLHVDHIKPVARNGSSDASNLRLLCSHHNQLEARRVLGEARMRPPRERVRTEGDP